MELVNEILHISKSCYGINAKKSHFLASSLSGQNVTFSCLSVEFIKEIGLKYSSDPFCKLLIDLLNCQSKLGDSGWFCILLCAQLVESAFKSDQPISSIIEGYKIVCRKVFTELNSIDSELRFPMCWSDLNVMTCLIESIIMPSKILRMNKCQSKFIADIIVDSTITSIQESDSMAYVINLHMSGYSIESSKLIKNSVLIDIPESKYFSIWNKNGTQSLSKKYLKIIVFENSLECNTLENINIETSYDNILQYYEHIQLTNMCNIFKDRKSVV